MFYVLQVLYILYLCLQGCVLYTLQLKTCFSEMWYHIFLWSLFSSILVHVVAGAIAFGRLRYIFTFNF